MSSTTNRILRPWMPPAAFTASKCICAVAAAGAPNAAKIPERSLTEPTTTSSSVTPWSAKAGGAMSAAMASRTAAGVVECLMVSSPW